MNKMMNVEAYRKDLLDILSNIIGDKEIHLYERIEYKCNIVVPDIVRRFCREIYGVKFKDGKLLVLVSDYDGDYWMSGEYLSTKSLANMRKILERE